ncbi:hypothetical protein BH160DRAFT_1779 [Burkholderia sp. H160]|nr:hypothetical protein BH160DRAFT_1779 [Burkholderia sp. H160]
MLCVRRARGEGGHTFRSIDRHVHGLIAEAVFAIRPFDARERDAWRSGRTIAVRSEFERARLNGLVELVRLHDFVDETPRLRAFTAHALDHRAENIRAIVTHLAFVGHARETARARQHAEQRHFRQRHRRGAIVDQIDFVAGEREFIAAARACAVHRGKKLQARMARRIFEPIAGFVRELAEVDLPCMRRKPQHEDICARAEHPVLQARHHHRADFRMLEANPLDRVVQFDIDAEVIRIELQFVAIANAAVLGDVDAERRDRTVEAQLPVLVLRRRGAVVDRRGLSNGGGCCGHRASPDWTMQTVFEQ